MVQLSVNLSNALIGLIQSEAVSIDAIEVGPWFSVQQIEAFQQQLPDIPFHFHPGNIILQTGIVPGTTNRLKRYLQSTQSPWASCHLSMLFPGYITLALKYGINLPGPSLGFTQRRFVTQAKKLSQTLDIPVILENMPALPDHRKTYIFESDPELIGGILAETQCELLLDLAHARTAAAIREIDSFEYLSQLPLERVVQIHLSGVHRHNGYLIDAHDSLEAIDYDLLEWVLERTSPQVITLEYFRESEPLRTQLNRLRSLIDRL